MVKDSFFYNQEVLLVTCSFNPSASYVYNILINHLLPTAMLYPTLLKGDDCRTLFQEAYENRYTWETSFRGYKGLCLLDDGQSIYKGSFILSNNMKVKIDNIDNKQINDLISSQLMEVAIHRVRREFDNVHSENIFTVGDENEIGLEVIVGGKNIGDKYRIKDKIITMVYRHIHGSLVNIFTSKVINTGQGYLSSSYTSQYFDPSSQQPKSGINKYNDKFVPIEGSGLWTLSSRTIEKEKWGDINYSKMKFTFNNLRDC